jgi:hypothetical protein
MHVYYTSGYAFLVCKFINFVIAIFCSEFLRQLRDDGANEGRLFFCPGFTGSHLHLSSRFVISKRII